LGGVIITTLIWWSITNSLFGTLEASLIVPAISGGFDLNTIDNSNTLCLLISQKIMNGHFIKSLDEKH
jgi:hypothetical protein